MKNSDLASMEKVVDMSDLHLLEELKKLERDSNESAEFKRVQKLRERDREAIQKAIDQDPSLRQSLRRSLLRMAS